MNRINCTKCNSCITANNIARHIVACNGPKSEKVKKFNSRNTGMKGRNQFSKARDEGREIPTVSDETKAKSLVTKKLKGSLVHSQETRQKMSDAMKRAVAANPESYSSSNRGRTKQIVVDGLKLQGQWEVDFYLWAKDNGILIIRPTTSFPYEWNGMRSYFPDFYLPELDLYIEVKGYETDRDHAKWLQFPKKLRIIKDAEIKEIRKGCFIGL